MLSQRTFLLPRIKLRTTLDDNANPGGNIMRRTSEALQQGNSAYLLALLADAGGVQP